MVICKDEFNVQPKTDAWYMNVQPKTDAWYMGDTVHHNLDTIWKHGRLRLRVGRREFLYYVAPYEFWAFVHRYEQMKIGPYHTLEEAQLAAEMIGEIGNKGYTLIEMRGE